VPEGWALPDAERLSEAGWLQRRTVDANGDIAWFCTLLTPEPVATKAVTRVRLTWPR
jgi:hypothetical protein